MLEGINILIVDDNILNQKIVSFILLKQGAVVKMAMNGSLAVALMKNSTFDIVLMDLQMPEMNGLTAIKYIRNDLKNNIPVIALTAGVFVDEINECISIGANACISKPVDPKGICDLILNLIKEHKKTDPANIAV